ncbi:MAG: 50S ribosomal protein L6 [Candidatus Bathyarchaeia archaeon]
MEARKIRIPENVEVSIDGLVVTVKGPLGTLRNDFSHASWISILKNGNEVQVQPLGKARKKKVAVAGTIASEIRNMIVGVTKGYTYKLKIVYAHFPMSVKVLGDKIVIENFAGERGQRIAKIFGNCKVAVQGDDVIVKGIDIDDVSQTAASIEGATNVRSKDPKVFLDGIFLYERMEGM